MKILGAKSKQEFNSAIGSIFLFFTRTAVYQIGQANEHKPPLPKKLLSTLLYSASQLHLGVSCFFLNIVLPPKKRCYSKQPTRMDDTPGSPEAGNPRDSDHGSAANISKQLRLHIILFWSNGNICGAWQYDIHPLHKFHLENDEPSGKKDIPNLERNHDF